MKLDALTLMAVTVFVTFIVGVLFLVSWNQARRTRALGVLGLAHLVGALASALLCVRGLVPDWLSIGLANALMLAAYGLIWGGARAFEGRRLPVRAIAAGPLAWAAACAVPAFYAAIEARIALASGVAGLYCLLAAGEIWRGRAEPLASRYPTAFLLASEAVLYWVRIPATFVAPPPPTGTPLASPWIAILCFGALLYTVAVAFLFMALAKERLEREQRLVAETDPLTGVANRRSLAAHAARLLAARPAVLLLFDLDHFKRINDTWGHAAGDAVLVGFCAAAQAVLPRQAVFGRLGGEEFACLLPGATQAEADALAETMRRAIAAMRPDLLPGLAVTVSVGLAAGGRDFEALLSRADRALYRAKALGRNRVVWAGAALRAAA
ncbi:hypothetical protein OPKNFCMD_1961 [Methylobacterium crusticola]|uniref:diguanylate cyclase n=1 Tax=Methylobacterium crusticola TaxID=1697972 RepID=A0ABQ4QV67_9HYPH|nr:GGDEF domain-containing protein [Methylobacterium crusticola]GJD49231.1 hypothetical protein OPKNFCMD_1961 [Methylobacterium crusticola]